MSEGKIPLWVQELIKPREVKFAQNITIEDCVILEPVADSGLRGTMGEVSYMESTEHTENKIMREALAKVARRELTGEQGHDEVVRICQQALATCDQMGG